PNTRMAAPVRIVEERHGSQVEECSATDRRISSPGRRFAPRHDEANGLMPSVVPRVQTISRGSALMNRATAVRAAAYSSAERRASAWSAADGLAFTVR